MHSAPISLSSEMLERPISLSVMVISLAKLSIALALLPHLALHERKHRHETEERRWQQAPAR